MRILFVAPRFHTNQAKLVEVLQDNGHDVRFIVANRGHTESDIISPTLIEESKISKVLQRFLGPGGPNKRRYFPKFGEYYRVFASCKPDVMVIRLHGKMLFFMSVVLARLFGTKIILYSQKSYLSIKGIYAKDSRIPYLKAILLVKLLRAKFVTPLLPAGLDEEFRDWHQLGFAVSQIQRQERNAGPLRFITVGKYENRKNQKLLIHALSQMDVHLEFEFLFVGEVSTETHKRNREECEAMVDRYGLSRRVTFLDNVDYSSMINLYDQSDIFVLPASNEPASVSVLEAMAAGLAVICSDTCGTGVYVAHRRNGFIFQSGNSSSLVEALEAMLYSGEQGVSEMGHQSLLISRATTDPSVIYGQFKRLLG